MNLNNRITIRLNDLEKEKLLKICKKEDSDMSKLIVRQIRILINQEAHFTNEELEQLRIANNQIMFIGRNLNQITRNINAGTLTNYALTETYANRLISHIDEQRKWIKALISKSETRAIDE